MAKQNKEDNIMVAPLMFADAERPTFEKKYNCDYIPFGKDNLYTNYLNSLYNRSAKHAAIINGKCDYIYGNGLVTENSSPQVEAFIEDKADLVKKIIFDIENSGGCYLDVIPNRLGTGYYVYHIQFSKIRTNEDNSFFWFSNDWDKKTYSKEISKPIPAFEKGIRERSILSYKEYRGASNDPYALPSWFAALNWIESDIQVSQHTFTNAKQGFNATKFINFYNGVPDNEGKRKVTNQFRAEHGGPSGESVIIAFNSPTDKAPTIDDLGESALSKEDFTNVNNLITENLYAGHSITVPELFGVPTTASLGGGEGSKLRTGYEIFKNTYCNSKQLAVEEIVNFIAKLEGVSATFKLKDIEPVGFEFTEAAILQVAPKAWVLEKMGIDASLYPDNTLTEQMQVEGQPTVNSTLTNLTGRQRQNVMGIVRKFTKGDLTKAQASILLTKGYGFTDEDVNDFLGIDEDPTTEDIKQAFSAHTDEDVAAVFACFGEDRKMFANIFSQAVDDSDTFFTFDTDIDISDYIKKHPRATPEVVAKELKLPLEVVKKVYPTLPKVGTKILPKFEIKYSYEKRPDAPGNSIIPTSRPFCVKMIELDRYYSRSDIQKISAVLGFDVFKRGGGFWGDKYHCRHQFRSNVVTRLT